MMALSIRSMNIEASCLFPHPGPLPQAGEGDAVSLSDVNLNDLR
jgi:hypothetical protein